ncbi:hypothetical protein GWI33_020230 [Rhynchophorus ferrugineus]|uniref:Uncharacterized protein n=1 Tax=Rhynchophorus ferrugineus TaxID=354439 RepID=A0A834M4F5_RHYFE|nr:hypothetical protein GWI33_020230 [Rhynchophorus ferrugineus]
MPLGLASSQPKRHDVRAWHVIIGEISECLQQLQNLANKFACLPPTILLKSDDTECNLGYAYAKIDEQDTKNDFNGGLS